MVDFLLILLKRLVKKWCCFICVAPRKTTSDKTPVAHEIRFEDEDAQQINGMINLINEQDCIDLVETFVTVGCS